MKNENGKTEICPKCESVLCLDLNNVSNGYDACCIDCDEDFYECEFKYKKDKKTQEVLASFTSEELLFEVHKRRNNNTDLPMQYCDVFMKWACDTACGEDLEVAVEQWLDITKGELKRAIGDNFAPARWGDIHYNIQFENLYTVEYDCDIGFCAELKDEFFNNDQSELRTDMLEYYMPHQGNLKTYLEDRMNKVINEYFSI